MFLLSVGLLTLIKIASLNNLVRSASHPPRFWYRFVDDTWVIQQQAHKELFLDHINSVDPAIKFTVEGNQEDGTIPFLDTLVKPMADNSLSIKVYCQPIHTDQYLQWDSHHNLPAKYSVIGTLTHRAKVVCTSPEILNQETYIVAKGYAAHSLVERLF